METSEEGLSRLLPNKFTVQIVTIYPGDDLNIWQPIERELKVNVGAWRIKEFLMDGKNSLILPYIYQLQCYANAFEDGKLDKEIFENVMFYTEERIKLAEDSIRTSIENAEVSSAQKAALNLLLNHLLDRKLVDNLRFSKYLKIYKNHRTKVVEHGRY